jgi:hypothetical protein
VPIQTPIRAAAPGARYAFVLAALAVWLAGVALRGGIVHPETVYDADPAFHDRMVQHLLDTGHYLEADPLFVQSPPRSPARDMYPTFYHYAAAGFAWLTGRLAGLPVADALMLFGSRPLAPHATPYFFTIFDFDSLNCGPTAVEAG